MGAKAPFFIQEEKYLNGFIKAYKKKRVNKEPLYRVSSLINFIEELNL